MKRRKQALNLELEHERKVLELRHQFELSSAKKIQSASVTNGSPSLEYSAEFQQSTPVIFDYIGIEGISSNLDTEPQEERGQSAQQSRAVGTTHDSTLVPKKYPQAETIGGLPLTTAKPDHEPYRKPSTQDRKSTAGNPDQATGKGQDKPAFESKDRRRSSSSTSVQIKTSISPRPVEHETSDWDKRRLPKVSHLTCYFWKNGHCTKSAAECSYAHHDTGVVATAPDAMKRLRRDGPWYRPGRW